MFISHWYTVIWPFIFPHSFFFFFFSTKNSILFLVLDQASSLHPHNQFRCSTAVACVTILLHSLLSLHLIFAEPHIGLLLFLHTLALSPNFPSDVAAQHNVLQHLSSKTEGCRVDQKHLTTATSDLFLRAHWMGPMELEGSWIRPI